MRESKKAVLYFFRISALVIAIVALAAFLNSYAKTAFQNVASSEEQARQLKKEIKDDQDYQKSMRRQARQDIRNAQEQTRNNQRQMREAQQQMRAAQQQAREAQRALRSN